MNITRRGFLQGAIGIAGAGMTGALTVPALKTLLPPPITRCNPDDAHETLTYKKEEGKWYEDKGGDIAKIEDFNLWDVAIVNWAPKELEEELGNCEIQLALAKVPSEDSMEGLGISVDEGNAMMMAYHTYKCPHLCCKPVFTAQGKSTISGNDFENMFLCPCHLSLFGLRRWVRENDLLIVVPWSFQDSKADVKFRYTPTQTSNLKRRGKIPEILDIY